MTPECGDGKPIFPSPPQVAPLPAGGHPWQMTDPQNCENVVARYLSSFIDEVTESIKLVFTLPSRL
jgi:hypothetical protein